MKTALVTGSSSGFGLVTSILLARRGYRVYAGMRNTAKRAELESAARDLPVTIVELDVTSQTSTRKAFDRVREAGSLDVLVNNAGIGGSGPLELVEEEIHRELFETNYFGAIRCIREALPEMRERRSGTIVNISSVEGRIAFPNQIPYSASKWALDAASEALAHEVRPFDVRVVVIEPGIFMTKIFENAMPRVIYDRDSPYHSLMRRNAKLFAAGQRIAANPERVAETILEAVETDEYKLRWPIGDDALSMLQGRRQLSDEGWVDMATLSDEEYEARYAEDFGVDDLRLTRRP